MERGKRWVGFLSISIVLVLFVEFAHSQESVLDITGQGFTQNFKLENFITNPDGWIEVPYLQKGSIIMEKFPYPSGTYKIKIGVEVDKKGFTSTINLYVNDNKIASINEDQDTGGAAWYEFKDIKINQGDKLIVEGINNGDELIRFSRLRVIKEEGGVPIQVGDIIIKESWRQLGKWNLEKYRVNPDGYIETIDFGVTGNFFRTFPGENGNYIVRIKAMHIEGRNATLNIYVDDKKITSFQIKDQPVGMSWYEMKKSIPIKKGQKITIEAVPDGPDNDPRGRIEEVQFIPRSVKQETVVPAAPAVVTQEKGISGGENLLQDGDFENVTDDKSVNWSPFRSPQNISICAEGKNHYILLDNSKNGAHTVSEQKLAEVIYPGKEYQLSFKAKVEIVEGDPVVCVMVANANWGPSENKYLDSAPEWKTYTVKFKPQVVYDRVLIRVAKGKAKVSVDDIKLSNSTSAPQETTKTATPFLKVKKDKNLIEVENPYFKTVVSSYGGKISQIQVKDYNWVVISPTESWATGIGKEWIEEDKKKEILTSNYDLSVLESSEDKTTIKVSYISKDILAGLKIEREFTFFSDKAEISVKTIVSNQTEKEITITPRIHNYLNIWKTLEEEPIFKVYISEKEEPIQLFLIPTLKETIKKGNKNSSWAGVIDSRDKNGLLFLLDNQGPDEWMVWSGFEKEKGTLEMCYKSIHLESKQNWQVSYHIFPTHALPSFGYASPDFIFSVGEPDIYLYFPHKFNQSAIKLQTETGGFYEYYKEEINPTDIIKIAISSILDPGKGTFSFKTQDKELIAKGIPRSTNVLPSQISAISSDEPYRYLPLTVKPTPNPGKDSFIYYASDYYQHEIYASPDVPTMIAFGQKFTLSKDKAVPNVRLILDLPVGFKVHGGKYIDKPIEVSSLEINGGKYKRFRINCRYGKWVNRSGVTEIIVSTDLKAPATFQAYYATEIDGNLYHRKEIPLHIISISEVGSPQKIMTWFWPLQGVLTDYPDISTFNKIGFKYPDPEYFNNIIKRGIEPARIGVDFMRFEAKEDEAKCVTIDGIKIEGLACPTYRGRYYKELMETGKKAIDLGVCIHFFDPERNNGKEVCFCNRCISQFKDYFQTNSALFYKSPKEFMQNSSQSPDYHQLWIKFKLEKENERYKDYRETMLNYFEEKGLKPDKFKMFLAAQPGWRDRNTRQDTIENSLQDPLILKDIFDYYAPMIYIEINGRFRMAADMLEIPEEIIGILEYSKGKVDVYPTLSVGYPYTDFLCNFEPNGMMKYQILEAFAAGAKGIVIYSEGWFDALDMKFFAEAMKQVLPVEDIIMKGKPIAEETIKDLNKQTFVKGIESEDGAVILVSEYSNSSKEAKVEYKIKKSAEVIDLSTGKKIIQISPANPTFNVVLNKERAKLFYIK